MVELEAGSRLCWGRTPCCSSAASIRKQFSVDGGSCDSECGSLLLQILRRKEQCSAECKLQAPMRILAREVAERAVLVVPLECASPPTWNANLLMLCGVVICHGNQSFLYAS